MSDEYRVIGRINPWGSEVELLSPTIFQTFEAALDHIDKRIRPIGGSGTIVRVLKDGRSEHMTTGDRIASMQAELKGMATPWKKDGSGPANWIREDGMGRRIAEVSRWCGGYQEPHKPMMIGWKVMAPMGVNDHPRGVLMLDEYCRNMPGTDSYERYVEAAIHDAKILCDKAIARIAPTMKLG